MTRKEAVRQTDQQNTLMALGFTAAEAEALRRISRTLTRWFEQECGDSNNYGSWAIVRGQQAGSVFTHDDDGRPFIEHHHYRHGNGKDTVSYTPVADREAGARKRLHAIVSARNSRCNCGWHDGDDTTHEADCNVHQPSVSAYVQTDPRGASLYIIRPGDVPEGQHISGYYTRGICVY